MALTDEQVLRWFGPPVNTTAVRRTPKKNTVVPDDVPTILHDDWAVLKKNGYSDDEARKAIAPSVLRLDTGRRLRR